MSDSQTHAHANYFLVFIALCILTLVSIVADVVQISSKTFVVVAVLAVATGKALFVMTYFMHLKFEGKWKYLLLAPTVILAMGLPLALLPDIGIHYYTDVTAENHEVLSTGGEGTTHPDASNPDH